jgi:hypothetical protein
VRSKATPPSEVLLGSGGKACTTSVASGLIAIGIMTLALSSWLGYLPSTFPKGTAASSGVIAIRRLKARRVCIIRRANLGRSLVSSLWKAPFPVLQLYLSYQDGSRHHLRLHLCTSSSIYAAACIHSAASMYAAAPSRRISCGYSITAS